MGTLQAIHIRTDEQFENLPRAPIVEAVIEIRSRATQTLEESPFRSTLEPRLTGYGFLDSLRGLRRSKARGRQDADSEGWRSRVNGFGFRSMDGKHIAQFKLDGFVFSRLEPYLTWAALESESKRL